MFEVLMKIIKLNYLRFTHRKEEKMKAKKCKKNCQRKRLQFRRLQNAVLQWILFVNLMIKVAYKLH